MYLSFHISLPALNIDNIIVWNSVLKVYLCIVLLCTARVRCHILCTAFLQSHRQDISCSDRGILFEIESKGETVFDVPTRWRYITTYFD